MYVTNLNNQLTIIIFIKRNSEILIDYTQKDGRTRPQRLLESHGLHPRPRRTRRTPLYLRKTPARTNRKYIYCNQPTACERANHEESQPIRSQACHRTRRIRPRSLRRTQASQGKPPASRDKHSRHRQAIMRTATEREPEQPERTSKAPPLP